MWLHIKELLLLLLQKEECSVVLQEVTVGQ
jgi:hypothetical protein